MLPTCNIRIKAYFRLLPFSLLSENVIFMALEIINSSVILYGFGLVVRIPGYGSRGPGSISGATRFSDK
jgi:hypothetical protein